MGKERRTRTEKANIGERILQQRVAGLETLQQLFLLDDRRRKPVNRSRIEALGPRVGTEPATASSIACAAVENVS